MHAFKSNKVVVGMQAHARLQLFFF